MTKNIENACGFLERLQRFDLALLLRHCQAKVEQVETGLDWFPNLENEAIVILAPVPVDEALQSLSQQDRKRVTEALLSVMNTSRHYEDFSVKMLDAPPATGAVALLAELLIQRAIMVSVATGGSRIQDVDDYYRAREVRIRETIPESIAYTNPHADLWAWYHHWKKHFSSYAERRDYIRRIFAPAIEAISKKLPLPSEPREATGWERVDRALSKARSQLETASAEEDCQAIGLLCREVIISLAQAVYNPVIHESLDGVRPSETDANRMLEAYIRHVFPGSSNKEIRAHHRASLALALNLQHRRTATRQLAALCVEATASTTTVVSIIARAEI